MSESSEHHNEYQFLKKVMIGLMMISLVSILVSALMQSPSTIPCGYQNNDVQCQIQSVTKQVSMAENSVGTSFNNVNDTPLTPANLTKAANQVNILGLNNYSFAALYNELILVPNFIAHIVLFVIAVVLLFLTLFGLLIFTLTSLIPTIFADTGIPLISGLFTILYGTTIVIVGGYVAYIALNRIMQLFG